MPFQTMSGILLWVRYLKLGRVMPCIIDNSCQLISMILKHCLQKMFDAGNSDLYGKLVFDFMIHCQRMIVYNHVSSDWAFGLLYLLSISYFVWIRDGLNRRYSVRQRCLSFRSGYLTKRDVVHFIRPKREHLCPYVWKGETNLWLVDCLKFQMYHFT